MRRRLDGVGYSDRRLIELDWIIDAINRGPDWIVENRIGVFQVCWDICCDDHLYADSDADLEPYKIFVYSLFLSLGRLLPDYGPASYMREKRYLVQAARRETDFLERGAIVNFVNGKDEISLWEISSDGQEGRSC